MEKFSFNIHHGMQEVHIGKTLECIIIIPFRGDSDRAIRLAESLCKVLNR